MKITKKARQQFFSNILQMSPIGVPLLDHHDTILELLTEHPAAEEKIGVGVGHFKVGLVPPYYGRGFFIVRVDGSSDDFSYRICLNGRLSAKQKAKRAFRNEIFPQIDAFRKETFASGDAACAITGEVVDYSTAEIDHALPNTFAKMMDEFLSDRDLLAEHIEVVSNDGGVTYCIIDTKLRDDWQRYHAENATLRALSPLGHKLSHANDNASKIKRKAA